MIWVRVKSCQVYLFNDLYHCFGKPTQHVHTFPILLSTNPLKKHGSTMFHYIFHCAPIKSPCQYTGLTWAFQFYRGPRPILWKCHFGTLYKIKILTDTYIISPIKSQPASNPSMSSNPKTLQNCSAQVKLAQGISSKLASIKLGPSKMAWS